MVESTQFAAGCAGMPTGSLSPAYVDAELERLYLAARMAAMHKQMRRERQARRFRHWASFWPVAMGVLLGFYAPLLHDLAAGYAPWAATLLFPLSAMAEQREIHFSWAMSQSLSQAMLFAQFPLDGLLARIVLKHRPTMLSVCGQVASLHALAVLYLGLVSGSLNQFLAN
jgi:hypothetical protein